MSHIVIDNTFPHFEAVGSYLRPAELKQAREKFADGEISASALRDIEDRLITDVIRKQKAHGLRYITDGEFRRSYWHLDFMWGFNGAEHIELDHGYQFHGEETTHGSVKLTGKITGDNHPFIKDFLFVKQFEEDGIEAKQTIPAPAQFLAELFRGRNAENTRKIYPNTSELIEDIAAAYRTFFREIHAAGCRTIQLDDCTWGMIVDQDYWKSKVGTGLTLEKEALQYLKVNNLAIEGKPQDLTVNTHVCRGNYHSCYATKGAYDPIAPFLFADEDVDTFYLEYDDERSGGFSPLKHVAEGKKVVLGLITSKSPVLEDKATVMARIREAAQYIPLDRLSLSPQCGFASCEIGNRLTEEEQWAKLDLAREISEEVWG
ncbi:MAG: 5-methyltetrahydropteroyltriglutamate--homocysteine S-methyltransferase [Prevotella sp.]|nr:5-methyltetrahydropteroyltriglutamate--homocysteine S-methyltransferase [Prevotella sp.]MDD7047206.1 5-methyltetrahydropteroyltriglutamate--homocysteine S-methyltransferase [Prevotella sp.]MDY5545872.1 5-methyltetrahydropteroyltriglutamate--homocysteine S-methyltransferase [Prevotella sp.]